MTRPTLEVADILRAQGDRFLDRYRSSFGYQQLKAFRAIQRCRTAALGGHRDACLRCGYAGHLLQLVSKSPLPQVSGAGAPALAGGTGTRTPRHQLFPRRLHRASRTQCLALENPRLFYDLLFTASAQTLLEIASDPKHLGAEIGVIGILHTWGQNLLLNPHS